MEQATFCSGMGLYGLLPSLPDPYVADVGWLRRQGRGGIRQQFVIQLLVADVAWTKADLMVIRTLSRPVSRCAGRRAE